MICFEVRESAFLELVVEANNLYKLQNDRDLWLIYRKGHDLILGSSANSDIDLKVREVVSARLDGALDVFVELNSALEMKIIYNRFMLDLWRVVKFLV